MKTRTSSGLVPLLLACLLFSACGPTGPNVVKPDTSEGPRLAALAADILTRFSAYDYALVGALNGERSRVVTPERYGVIARAASASVSDFSSQTIAATAEAAGPIRDRVVKVADVLSVLGHDAISYADTGEAAALASVFAGVGAGWQELEDLARALPPDEDLALAISRGTSFVVAAEATQQFVLTVGPFTTRPEAQAAASRIGSVESVSGVVPFVVRVGTYPTRPAAEAAAAGLVPRGFQTSAISTEERFTFARSGPPPDIELWREPARVFDTWNGARRVAIAPDGAWIATGSDDGTVAIFSGDGVLTALPRFNAGVAHLAFSDDGKWLAAGGLTQAALSVPAGRPFGVSVRLPSPATQLLFVPKARAFVATSRGPTGLPAGGPGAVSGRAPDGAALGSPFPLTTPAAGAVLAASAAGELYIGTPGGDGTDIERLRLGIEGFVRGVVRVPGTVRMLAVDPSGVSVAALTDQAVYRFSPHSTDPSATLATIGGPARGIAFGPDGTLYVMEARRLVALGPAGGLMWEIPLIDGRRLIAARRTIVLDGADRVIAVDIEGTVNELGSQGVVQDLSASPDGARIAVLVDARRALLFTLP